MIFKAYRSSHILILFHIVCKVDLKMSAIPLQKFYKCFRNRMNAKAIFYLGGCAVCLYFLLFGIGFLEREYRSDERIKLLSNYFQSQHMLLENRLLIDGKGKCRIPNLNEWSDGVKKQPFYDNSEYNCHVKQPRVTYVKGEEVVINETLLSLLGYSLETVTCCYKSIRRVEQSIANYDDHADLDYKVSHGCKKMNRVTRPTSPFFKVICRTNLLRVEPFFYIQFHALPVLPGRDQDNQNTHERTKLVKEKLKFWKDCANADIKSGDIDKNSTDFLCNKVRTLKYNTLPNVLMIGIDSTSRLNFRRFLKKSVKKLEEIGAVEMLGYTKVGHNTLPNFIPLSTSFSLSDVEKTCFTSSNDPFDDCPFVWKEFSAQKYLTAHMEDSPKLGIFNFLKTGFVEQPTDFYMRPLMRAIYDFLKQDYSITCMGYQRPEEIVLNFATDLLKLAHRRNAPVFITTWLTDLVHEHMNSVEVMDNLLESVITKLEASHLLQNTVLMVISDHGYRFLPIRRTLSGWYENSLPAFWIHIPDSVKALLPKSGDSLLQNSKILTTPYDVHATLKHILHLNLNKPDMLSKEKMFRVRNGFSILSQVPSRSCEEAAVPNEYCACRMPIRYETNHSLIQNAVKAAIAIINDKLTAECAPLKLSFVYLSGVIRGSNDVYYEQDVNDSITSDLKRLQPTDTLLVGFVTTPGNFMFDSRIEYDLSSRSFTKVVGYARTDQIQVSPKCVKHMTPFLEEYCFCK